MTDVIKSTNGAVVASLEQNEEIISRGLATFIEVGNALMAINDGQQYRKLGYDTFEDYCRERWDLGRSTAYQQMDAARVVKELRVRHGGQVPRSERVARPLVKVMNEQGVDTLRHVWTEIVTKKRDDKPVTSADVNRYLHSPANYGGASWHELIGMAGETLNRAAKQVGKLEAAINRKPSAEFMEKAEDYAVLADEIAARLRSLGGDA